MSAQKMLFSWIALAAGALAVFAVFETLENRSRIFSRKKPLNKPQPEPATGQITSPSRPTKLRVLHKKIETQAQKPEFDVVEIASIESFPASDAPGWRL